MRSGRRSRRAHAKPRLWLRPRLRPGTRPGACTARGSNRSRLSAPRSGRRSASSADHRDLGDVDRAAAEPAFAIHQIIAPQVVELGLETRKIATLEGGVIAIPPQLQGPRIVEPEGVALFPRQPAFAG